MAYTTTAPVVRQVAAPAKPRDETDHSAERLVIQGDLSPGGDTRPDGMQPFRSAESIFNRLLDESAERRRVTAGLPPRRSAPLLEVLEAAE